MRAGYVSVGRGGEIGRRKGLKIPWGATPVQVRVLPSACEALATCSPRPVIRVTR